MIVVTLLSESWLADLTDVTLASDDTYGENEEDEEDERDEEDEEDEEHEDKDDEAEEDDKEEVFDDSEDIFKKFLMMVKTSLNNFQ